MTFKRNIFKPFAAFLLLSSMLWSVPAAVLSLDVAGMDRTVKPGDDFFRYANGSWLKTAEIPADRSSFGAFNVVANAVDQRMKELISNAAKGATPEEKMVADYYTAFMDEQAIEKRGLEALQPELSDIEKIKDLGSLSSFLGSQLRNDVDPLNNTNFQTDKIFGTWISADFNNPTRNIPYLLQGGLSMPDRDYYLKTDDESKALQQRYKQHIVTMLKLANIADAEAKAARIYDLEVQIARTHATREESGDVHKADNPWKLSDFSAKAPGLKWDAYFKSANISDAPIIMAWHPAAITGISALVASQPINIWKEYLTYHAIDRSSGLLPKAFADEGFSFYRGELFGVKKQRERSARAIASTSNALGDLVGKLYAEKYFPPKAKSEIQAMVKNIIAAFGKRIDSLTWMTDGTRAKAKEKLKTLYVGVGYPDQWRSYKGLKIVKDDALGNAQRVDLFDYQWSLQKLQKPVDKTEWWMTPQTVNAVNLPLQNALNFPAAYLNPPYFDMNADPVENYGSIGATIGHEISHSFDDTGSQFDASGRLVNWWTPADYEHFQAASKQLAAQYDAYEPLPGLHINGKQTLGENIADVAGLSAAYDAYRTAYGGKEAPSAQGMTGDQRFFVSFGQSWRDVMRPALLKLIVTTDGHSPDEFRADTVRNLDGWYTAFDVKPGDKLYLAPKDRVHVW